MERLGLGEELKMLINNYLSGNKGCVTEFFVPSGVGTTTAAAVYAAHNEMCYVSNDPTCRGDFIDVLFNIAGFFEFYIAKDEFDGFKITKNDGASHRVYVVPATEAWPVTTFVEDGDPVDCGAPVVVFKRNTSLE